MSILSRIFGSKQEATEKHSGNKTPTPHFNRLLDFGGALMHLLNEDRYIARSDYKHIVEEYADIKKYFLNLQDTAFLNVEVLKLSRYKTR